MNSDNKTYLNNLRESSHFKSEDQFLMSCEWFNADEKQVVFLFLDERFRDYVNAQFVMSRKEIGPSKICLKPGTRYLTSHMYYIVKTNDEKPTKKLYAILGEQIGCGHRPDLIDKRNY